MTCYQYGISAIVSQTSFLQLWSREMLAVFLGYISDSTGIYDISEQNDYYYLRKENVFWLSVEVDICKIHVWHRAIVLQRLHPPPPPAPTPTRPRT